VSCMYDIGHTSGLLLLMLLLMQQHANQAIHSVSQIAKPNTCLSKLTYRHQTAHLGNHGSIVKLRALRAFRKFD